MIQNASFQRKVIYLGLIALLMIPLYVIGQPATKVQSNPGGRLAQLRTEYDLAPAELGEINPASESMKLATLGMRGVAASILWLKTNHYKKTEDWEKFVGAVKQMTKLQPNFVSVWEFQSHNLSYNISVEHDDYRFRYLWVKKGIEFLLEGTRYNRREPKLYGQAGWFLGQKVGRPDEYRQFRRLFPEDKDFHNTLNAHVHMDDARGGRENKPDNWLTSRLWYQNAYSIIQTGAGRLRGTAPHIFYAHGPKTLMNYADAIESEGILDEHAEYAWKRAGDAWVQFGDRVVPHTSGIRFRLNDLEQARLDADRLAQEFEDFLPGLREGIRQEKIDALSPADRKAFDMPYEEIIVAPTSVQMRQVRAEQAIMVNEQEAAQRAPKDKKAKAIKLANDLAEQREEARKIEGYQENVNYAYWMARCEIEQLNETVSARNDVYNAKEAMERAELLLAKQLFESAWDKWAKLFNDHPELVNQLTEDDLFEDIQHYVRLLGQLDEEIPEDFALRPILEKYDRGPAPDPSEAPLARPGDPLPNTPGYSPPPTEPHGPGAEPKPVESEAPEDKEEKKPAEDKPAEDKPAEEEKPEGDAPAEKPEGEESVDDKPAEPAAESDTSDE